MIFEMSRFFNTQVQEVKGRYAGRFVYDRILHKH